MVSGPIDFVGEYSLNLAWLGRKKMFQLLGVRTHAQFIAKMESYASKPVKPNDEGTIDIDAIGGTPDEVYEKIIYAALMWKHPEVKLEIKDGDLEGTVYVSDLIEKYFLDGHDLRDLDDKLMDVFVEAGLYNRQTVQWNRYIREVRSLADVKELLQKIEKSYEELEKPAADLVKKKKNNTVEEPNSRSKDSKEGEDMGETGSSQPISTK